MHAFTILLYSKEYARATDEQLFCKDSLYYHYSVTSYKRPLSLYTYKIPVFI